VAAALAGLEPDQRAILILRDVQGLEYEQIAAVLEIAGGTVKSRLFRARVALREALEKLEGPGAVRDR
jgi:RNA polymerase sigma-70 factor (ECF subfamily)